VKLLGPEAAFSEQEFRKRLVRMVVEGMVPFSTVDLKTLRSAFNLLKPGVPIPSAKTLKSDLMACFREEDDRINERLRRECSKISVTLDCWVSPNNKAYLGVTGHYIDKNWALQSLLLDFVPLPGPHTGANMCGALVDVCKRRGILDKLLGVTSDNAANIGKLLTCLKGAFGRQGVAFSKEQQHVRCVAHVVNLAVQEFLGELKAEDATVNPNPDRGVATQTADESSIIKLRRAVRWIRSSPQRSDHFESMCKRCKVPKKKKAILDSPTRWNSTYFMIKRAIELREPLSLMMEVMKEEHPGLSDSDWELLEVAGQVLGIFEEGTRWLCAANYPTLNKAVCAYNHLLDELEYYLGQCNDEEGREKAAIIDQCDPANKRVLTAAMKAAHTKLRGYYADTWAGIYAVSLILDPSTDTPGLGWHV
jgi:hypothetical protein